MTRYLQRRGFITLLGGAAAWPIAAHAQQPAMPSIGFLAPTFPETNADRLRKFHEGLKQEGYVERENVAIEFRWAQGRYDRLPALAAELVQRHVSILAAIGGDAPMAAKAATAVVPVVFAVNENPVKLGLVASLSRPGGNATGVNYFTGELAGKRLDLLHELIPGAVRVAVLVNPANPANSEVTLNDVRAAARARGMQILAFNASTNAEIDAAFESFARDRPDALYVAGDAFFTSRRVQLVSLAARHALPAQYSIRELTEAGGLMSYGTNIADAWRQAGVYVGRILKGAKPAELPVVQASKFELILNRQTAKTLGLSLPDRLLAIADEVIE